MNGAHIKLELLSPVGRTPLYGRASCLLCGAERKSVLRSIESWVERHACGQVDAEDPGHAGGTVSADNSASGQAGDPRNYRMVFGETAYSAQAGNMGYPETAPAPHVVAAPRHTYVIVANQGGAVRARLLVLAYRLTGERIELLVDNDVRLQWLDVADWEHVRVDA